MTDLQELAGADVLTLGMAADEVRRARPEGRVVTYLRVHTVTAGDLAAGNAIPPAASEVRLYELPSTLDEAVAQVRTLASLAGGRRVAAFSMADLESRPWGDRSAVLRALIDAGLQDVAELPADRLDDLAASIQALVDAGANPQRITIAQPLGDRRFDVINRVREALDRFTSVARFSPLPRHAPTDKPTTGYDDVRMVAMSRLALGTRSIEVDWLLYGPKLAQVALTFGADHLDAVPAVDDESLGRRRATLSDLARNIEAAGFEPREYRPSS